MIVPMKKVTLVVLDRERETALKILRKTGVMHVERRAASGQTLTDLQSSLASLDQAIALLTEAAPGKAAPKSVDAKASVVMDANPQSSVAEVLSIRDSKRAAQETVVSLTRELERFDAWGDVNPLDFDALAQRGLYLFPFEMTVQEYTSLPATVRSIVLNRDKKSIRCVIWGEDDLLHAEMPAGARELVMPAKPTVELREELRRALAEIPECERSLAEKSAWIPALTAYRSEVLAAIEFETIRSGMPTIRLGDEASPGETAAVHANATVAWLTGFVPVEGIGEVMDAAKKHGWACISEDPSEEDAVPTMVRNNRFVNLISPLLEFLGTVPGYREIDISLWFLLFFGVFFAMIFGDAGYGSLLAVLACVSIVRTYAKGGKPATGLFMMLYLSLMTVAWGTITCTWFGMPVASLPDFLVRASLPAFSNANPGAADNIKVFCFTLGLIQISLAHVIGIVRNRTSPKLLGEAGALMMTVGMYFVVLNLVVSADKYPLSNGILAMIGGGFLLNFVFINYAGSLLGGIVESLKNFITMFLGIVNMFGDIMSYIRLWAVGLAGSAISATVNSMAGPFLGGFIIFAGMVLLLFGHGLNLVMNVLSVIVHGVRLNTLEFSNHLGLTWSGFKYEPFAETAKK